MKVKFNDLNAQWSIIKEESLVGLNNLFEKSNFILGEQVKEFEDSFAKYAGSKYAVGVSSGTDALKLSAQALNLNRQSITDGSKSCFIIPANTFVATLGGIEQAYPNAWCEFIDCDENFQMDVSILETFVANNRSLYDDIVIVPVHLYGYSCDMTSICKIAKDWGCLVLEDCSQAHGTKHAGQPVGSFGDISAFSLYPGKNLGAAGDAGIITTNSEQLYNRLLKLRNLGSVEKHIHDIKGGNHRLDTIQAIILNEKIKYIEEWNQNRRNIVETYEKLIVNPYIKLPKTPDNCLPTHHVYPVIVENREHFTSFLDSKGIDWGMHYKICIEEMAPYHHLVDDPNEQSIKNSRHMVSLPIHPFMSEEEVEYLCKCLNEYSV